jgi:HlyD family secretion protein
MLTTLEPVRIMGRRLLSIVNSRFLQNTPWGGGITLFSTRTIHATISGLVIFMASGGAALAQMGGPSPVYTEPVEQRNIRRSVELTGVTEACRKATVGSEASGRVEKMSLDAGAYATAGSPICQLRRLPVELQLKQAEGQAAAAQAQLKKAQDGFRPEEVRQAEARVKAAQAAYDRARQDLDRTEKLFADKASTPAERDAVLAASRVAKEQLSEAEAALALVKAGMRAEDIEAARGQAATAVAAVDALKDTLAKMTIAMPFDGFVTKKLCEEGEWLAPGTPVAEVADLGVVRIQLNVPERYLAGLEKGAKAPVVFESLGDREFAGLVSQVVPQSTEGTHTIPVRVDVKNEIAKSRPTIAAGLFAKVALPVGEEHPALLVPKAAVIRQGGRDLVYTLTDARPAGALKAEADAAEKLKAEKKDPPKPAASLLPPVPVQYAVAVPVKIIQGYGRYMEIECPTLKAGTPVVTRGTYLLSQDTAVQVYPKESADAPAPAAKPASATGTAQ